MSRRNGLHIEESGETERKEGGTRIPALKQSAEQRLANQEFAGVHDQPVIEPNSGFFD